MPFIREYQLAAIVLVVILLIVIHPRIMEHLINKVLNILKKENIRLFLGYKDILHLVAVSIANWMVVGIGFYLLVNSVYLVSLEYFFYLAGTFGLSVIIGILSFFAPSGIGVREGVIILALKFIMPEGAAIIIALLSRIWTVIPELSITALAYVYAKVRRIKFNVPVSS